VNQGKKQWHREGFVRGKNTVNDSNARRKEKELKKERKDQTDYLFLFVSIYRFSLEP
jgi:hypothetical protein